MIKVDPRRTLWGVPAKKVGSTKVKVKLLQVPPQRGKKKIVL